MKKTFIYEFGEPFIFTTDIDDFREEENYEILKSIYYLRAKNEWKKTHENKYDRTRFDGISISVKELLLNWDLILVDRIFYDNRKISKQEILELGLGDKTGTFFVDYHNEGVVDDHTYLTLTYLDFTIED